MYSRLLIQLISRFFYFYFFFYQRFVTDSVHSLTLIYDILQNPPGINPNRTKKINAMYITITLMFKPETQNRTDTH